MALGDSYSTLTLLRSRLGITDATYTAEDAKLTTALAVASRGIEGVCNRQFNDAGSASARLFYPDTAHRTKVYDFSTATGFQVAVDNDNDGTYETTWATTDYQLEPLDGIVDGVTGWPYWFVRAVGNQTFPCPWWGQRAPLQITARWGWSAVPAPVAEATLILAEEIYKLKDSPFGSGGVGQFGIIRARQNPFVMVRVGPYINEPVPVG